MLISNKFNHWNLFL
uniref:Uncharacterized protein n=1 Tax=Lepeophtheirus salmonis TaxID=72036 RepID=A0A0K2U5P1_LEPSM